MIATARISTPCFWQFSVRLLTRSVWNFSRSWPLMNWPPDSFEPPMRQSDRLSGVMILAMISSSIASPLADLVVLDEHLGDFIGQNAKLDHAVERDRKSVGRQEAHLGFLAQVESARPAIDLADARLIGIEVVCSRLEGLLLNPALAFPTRNTLGFLESVRRAVSRRRESPRDCHRVVQLDRFGIRVIWITARFEDLAKDPLLARLGEDLARRQVVATQGDPDADLVSGHDELGADLPRPEIRVVKVAAFRQTPLFGPPD